MTTTPEATKGIPRIEGNPAPSLRTDHNALADWIRDNTDVAVATKAALPLTGNWYGRTITVTGLADAPFVWKGPSRGWYRAGGGTFRGTRSGQAVGNASTSTIGQMTRDGSATGSYQDDFATIAADGVSLVEGDYSIVGTYYIGAAAAGRSFLNVTCGPISSRGAIPSGEDSGSAGVVVHVPSTGLKASISVFQQTGGTQTGSQTLTITKIA